MRSIGTEIFIPIRCLCAALLVVPMLLRQVRFDASTAHHSAKIDFRARSGSPSKNESRDRILRAEDLLSLTLVLRDLS